MKLRTLSLENIASKTGDKTRDSLITQGRLLLAEETRRKENETISRMATGAEKHTLMLSNEQWDKTCKVHRDAFLGFALKQACTAIGCSYTGTEMLHNANIRNSESFRAAAAAIISEIVSPLFPIVSSSGLDFLVQDVTVGYGQTKEITVESNDVMMFDDVAWGVRSQHAQYLYNKTFTLDPQPKAARAKINFYDLLTDPGKLPRVYYSIAKGADSYIFGSVVGALNIATMGTFFIPSELSFATYSTDNLMLAAELVTAVNGGGTPAIFGSRMALSKILPDPTTQGGLQYGIGYEWFKMGFIATPMGIPAFVINNALVPGTTDFMMPTDKVFVAALGAEKPIYVGYEGDRRMDVILTPRETADMTMDIESIMSIDVKPVFASKIALIDNVA